MVDELAPGVDHGAHQAVAGGALTILVTEGVADGAGAGQAGTRRAGNTIGVGGGCHTDVIGPGLAPVGMGQIVPAAIHRVERPQNGGDSPLFQGQQVQSGGLFPGRGRS